MRGLIVTIDYTKALDLAGSGKWDEAHRLVQQSSEPLACLIHAYLHRSEGDLDNARYWYRRAGEPMPRDALEAEWKRLWKRVGAPR